MLRKVILLLVVIMAFSSVFVAFGQGAPPGRWWRKAQIAKVLNLSEVEKQRLDELFVKSRRKLIKLKNRVEEAQFDLENLLEEQQLDKAAIMEQFRSLEKARSQLSEERFRFLLGVREILGYERFERLKDMYRNRKMRQRSGKPW